MALSDFSAARVLNNMTNQNPIDIFHRANAAQIPAWQGRLFPSPLPRIEGLDFHGECRPAYDAGGDFYDFAPLEPGGLALSLGDVSGHGPRAGILTSGLQALLRALTRQGGREIGAVVRELNRTLWQTSPDNCYATLFYAYLDPVLGELQYVSAGHESALLIRRRSGRVHRLESTGTVLGLSDRVVFGQRTLPLEAGDLLIAHSDGVTEAANPDGLEFGEQGIVEVVQRHPHARAIDLANEILQAVDQHTGRAQPADDRTAVVVRLKDAAAKAVVEEQMAMAAA